MHLVFIPKGCMPTCYTTCIVINYDEMWMYEVKKYITLSTNKWNASLRGWWVYYRPSPTSQNVSADWLRVETACCCGSSARVAPMKSPSPTCHYWSYKNDYKLTHLSLTTRHRSLSGNVQPRWLNCGLGLTCFKYSNLFRQAGFLTCFPVPLKPGQLNLLINVIPSSPLVQLTRKSASILPLRSPPWGSCR